VLKVIMAVTGSMFAAFVVFHMAGNLKVYMSKEDFDHYAHWLRGLLNPLVPGEGVLWILRLVLVVALVLHVYSGITIWARARKARGVHARKLNPTKHHLTGRTMIWTGLVLLCFIIFHILDLTVGAKPLASEHFEPGSAYDNLVYSFERPVVAGFYILTMALLFFHLSHGLWSVINDLGGTAHRLRSFFLIIADLVAIVVVLGNLSIPISVLAGVVTR
jgi:succinate dehydrogenase / fumarate reductase cytochrome b subunit